jgi:hypothetical protein
MAATINGSLRTWYGSDLNGRDPFIRFIPSGVGIGTTGVYAGEIKDVTEFSDGGRFTVPLESTIDKRPERWYTFELHYFSASGQPVRVDYPELRLYVPGNGTYEFGDIATGMSNPFMVWVSLESPPPGPGVRFWLETNPNDVEDPRNTGLLYEWRD